MDKQMAFGYILAMQGVKEKACSILSELKSKGHDEPLGFSVLLGFIEDGLKDAEASLTDESPRV